MRIVTLRGHRLHIVDDKPSFWDNAEAGAWEPETLAAIEAHLQALAGRGAVFVDIGAWVGPTALFAAGLGASVLAVEADPVAFGLLRDNIAANPALPGQITPVHAAASATPGTIRFGAPRKLGDSMGSILLAGRTQTGFETAAVTPADIAACLPPGPRVIKIDIEGGEYDLLPACGPLFVGAVAALVAFHPGILAQGGLTPDAIRKKTRDACAIFAGFGCQIAENSASDVTDILEVASRKGCTVVFSRKTS